MHLSRTCKSQAPLLPSGDSPLRRRDVERKARSDETHLAARVLTKQLLDAPPRCLEVERRYLRCQLCARTAPRLSTDQGGVTRTRVGAGHGEAGPRPNLVV